MRILVVACVASGLAFAARAQNTYLVDALPNGAPPAFGAAGPAIGRSGNFVAFQSHAPDLVAGDTNAVEDVFVRDEATGQIERVSLSSAGSQGDGPSQRAKITPNGRFVAFSSAARNFSVPGDPGSSVDAFVRDRLTGTTTKASVALGGGEASGDSDVNGISYDGTRVVFTSIAPDLVAGDTNGHTDVFLRDLSTGVTTLVSASLSGGPGNHDSWYPSTSKDGRFVAFSSIATDLVPGDTNASYDIFVRDLQAGSTVRASVASSGAQGNADASTASISADGRFVAFGSLATNLHTPDLNPFRDVFVRDLWLGTTVLASVATNGVQANYLSDLPSLSDDGRYLAFASGAWNLHPGQPYAGLNVYRRDLVTGETILVSRSYCGVPLTQQCTSPAISPDGSAVAFASRVAFATPNDVNGQYDVFVHDFSLPPPSQPFGPYCVVKPTSQGCLPTISATGIPSASAASGFVVSVTSADGQRTGVFFQGTDPAVTPFGSTYMCVQSLGRFGTQSTAGTKGQCDGAISYDWNAVDPWWIQAGFNAYVQAWFRDSGSPITAHLSNALELVVQP